MHFFLDFDGTISTGDVVDLVLENFADQRWKDVEQEWVEGRIGSRECLLRQTDMIRATTGEIFSVIAPVKLDPHYVSFLKKARALGVPVTIVSDGFDLLIRQVLKQNLGTENAAMKGVEIYSNKLERADKGFRAVFSQETPCGHGCANCKEALIHRLKLPGEEVYFVGDGLSDRYAAKCSDLTFAKGTLLTFCRENGIQHVAYENFKKIEQTMTQKMTASGKVTDGCR